MTKWSAIMRLPATPWADCHTHNPAVVTGRERFTWRPDSRIRISRGHSDTHPAVATSSVRGNASPVR